MMVARLVALVGALLSLIVAPQSSRAQATEPAPLIMVPPLPREAPSAGPSDALSEAEPTLFDWAARAVSATGVEPESAEQDDSQTLVTPQLVSGETALVKLSDDGALRLSGERVQATLALDLPSVPFDTPLTFSYRNSINILPEASTLTVSVNGVAADPVPLDAFGSFVTIEIASDAWVNGRNEVVIAASQSHRIFCGIDASFQIWTEIDLSRTGVGLPPNVATVNVASVINQLAAGAADGPILLRATPLADTLAVSAMAERLSQLTDGRAVTTGTPWDPDTNENKAPRVVIEPGAVPSAEVVTGADGADVLRIRHGPVGRSDPAASLPDLDPADTAGFGFRAGRRRVPGLTPGGLVPLSALGFEPHNEIASFLVESVPFRLPPDWLELASQKAHLYLDYRFPPGLTRGSNLFVKANGTTVRQLPLDRNGGEDLPTLDVGFLASLLGPGVNEITFEVILPAEDPDLPCPPWPDEVITIEPSSELFVPQMPSMYFDGMERALSALTASGVEFGGLDGRGNGGFNTPTQHNFAAAFALPATSPVEAGRSTRLNVIYADAFSTAQAGDLALSRRMVAGVLDRDQLRSGRRRVDHGSAVLNWLVEQSTRAMHWVVDTAMPGGAALQPWLTGKTGDAMLIQPLADRPDRLILILSLDADPAGVARKIAADRSFQHGPRGRVAILEDDGSWQVWRPPFDPPRLSGSVNPANLRLVLGNYASWLPAGFTGLLFLLTAFSATVVIFYLQRTRSRGDR